MTDDMRNEAVNGAESEGRKLKEEFRVSGEAVLSKVKELVREGNVRRITIKNDDGRTLIEIPLTLGVIGTVLLPVWAAIGAIAALAANLTIAVERVEAPVAAQAPTSTDALIAPTHGVVPDGSQERSA
ncbi:MAG: DUF4342 domain-containing protein [Trueperaceae bacterium]|nr:DUF4342 domain-containing protein [Trueperaceae bacterium]